MKLINYSKHFFIKFFIDIRSHGQNIWHSYMEATKSVLKNEIHEIPQKERKIFQFIRHSLKNQVYQKTSQKISSIMNFFRLFYSFKNTKLINFV